MAPVAPSTPDGMSTASTGTPEALIDRAAASAAPSRRPRKPVPYIASMTSADRASARSALGVAEAGLEQELVDPDARLPETPRRDRPSAPLLPFPATTVTRRPYAPPSTPSAWRATARPARSTSTDSGVPVAIACRSAAAISAGVSTGCISPSAAAPELSAPLLLPVVGQSNHGLGEELDQTDPAEHVVAHDGLDLGHLVGDGLVAIAVALEHPARGIGREPIEEPHVQAA